MQITLNKQVDPLGTRQKFIYSTDGNILTVRQGELEETFDFTIEFTDGEFEVQVDTLTENPIIKAKKVSDEVELVLRQYESIQEYMQRKESDDNG